MTHEEVSTRAALSALAEQYAAGVDRRAADAFLAVFLPDARLRVYNPSDSGQPTADLRGHDELRGILARIAVYTKTFHLLGNARYEIGEGQATGEVYCMAHHLNP